MDRASAGAQESLIGKVGRVTVSVPAGGPGEVLLPVRGGTEAFAALSDEPIARHTWVVVVEALSGRSVFVTPFQQTQFRIVTGHGCFVTPVKQKARVLSLALREAEIVEECITSQGIRLNVRAVAAFKVGDDQASIANAARRFLSEQDRMEVLVGRVFAGHLRSIIGGLTVEQIIRERDRVAQEIKDATGYISNLAAPHAATVASQARIAKAHADQEAAERELAAAATGHGVTGNGAAPVAVPTMPRAGENVALAQ